METCAYKELNYFEQCSRCTGKNKKLRCYSTRHELELHLDEFRTIFDLDNGELEEKFEAAEVWG